MIRAHPSDRSWTAYGRGYPRISFGQSWGDGGNAGGAGRSDARTPFVFLLRTALLGLEPTHMLYAMDQTSLIVL